MPTDYVLFNHGVSVRKEPFQPGYADKLFKLIQQHAAGRNLKPIELYWGDLAEDLEQKLLEKYQGSPIWNKIWFKQFRENQITRFVGDGALYISRYCGSRVADAMAEQAAKGLQGYNPQEDRLHIVTHSMGTVILFDILFSARWDPDYIQGHASVEAIRRNLFGTSPQPTEGIRIGSISTMGSPIGFFTLVDVNQAPEDAKDANGNIISTHDITPRLEKLLDSLHLELGEKLPWYNFVHPGDPIAYPLEKLLPDLVDGSNKYLDVQDILTHPTSLTDFLTEPASQTLFALLHGGDAHRSYWDSDQVAEKIVQAIEKAPQAIEKAP